MNRRAYLGTVGASSLALLAGCTEILNGESDDTGGDEEPSGPPDTPSYTTETVEDPNPLDESARRQQLSAKTEAYTDPDVGFPNVRSHIVSYSFDEITVVIRPDGDQFAQLEEDSTYAIRAYAQEYPDGSRVGSGQSERFQPPDIQEQVAFTVPMDYREAVVGDEVSILVAFARDIFDDDDSSRDELITTNLFAGTDPFTVTETGIQPFESSYGRDSETLSYDELTTEDHHPQEGRYRVHNAEGGYFVYYQTSTPPNFLPILFEVPFYIPKQIYARWKEVDRPYFPEAPDERTSYVSESREDGIGEIIGSELETLAELQGITDDETKIEFFSTFVQSLPYALDPISTGFSDYSRYPAETLVDAKGDCVDTSILLAVALLESSVPCDVAFFSYSPEAVAASDSGHLAVAIAPERVSYPGAAYAELTDGRRFYYIEPTGFFKPSEVPPNIDFSQTEIHQIQ